jgi:preprotein translocase subunit SecE
MELFNKIKLFLKEAYNELKKVSWLSRKEVISSTIAIIVFILIVALFVGLIDFLLSYIMGVILHR